MRKKADDRHPLTQQQDGERLQKLEAELQRLEDVSRRRKLNAREIEMQAICQNEREKVLRRLPIDWTVVDGKKRKRYPREKAKPTPSIRVVNGGLPGTRRGH